MNQNFGTCPITKEELEQRKIAYEKKQAEERARAYEKFRILALPTLIYAIITTICLYDSFSGITMPVFALATVIYVRYLAKRMNPAQEKCGWIFYAGAMIAFGVSDTLTANGEMIFYNNMMICILIVGMVLYCFYEQKEWTISKYIAAFFQAIFGGICTIGDLFGDTFVAIRCSKDEKTKTGLYVAIGLGLFLPIGALLIALLKSADAVFNQILEDLLINLNFVNTMYFVDTIFLVVLFFVIVYIGAYCGMRYVDKREIKEETRDLRKWPSLVANTILALIGALYVFFSGIQIFSLFLGKMKLPSYYTYAEYAREGFFQLMTVCFLNLCIVLFIKGFFKKSLITNILLTLICACTFIMIGSSAMRLGLYIKAYNLTLLRLEVAWALGVIAISMVLVLISIYYEDLKLMHCLTFVACLAFLVLTFSKPDAYVAGYNLSHVNQETDYDYLSDLSEDAALYILKEDGYWVEDYKANHQVSLNQNKFIRKYNFSKAQYEKLLNEK